MSKNLQELKRIREENFKKHKNKKREYYLKSKDKNSTPKYKSYKEVNYSEELNDENFVKNIKLIAKKQKSHMENREVQILEKMLEYKKKKQKYYKNNKERRLEYDKEYREKRKEELKRYRREYYRKNREKILQQQKEKRLAKRESHD